MAVSLVIWLTENQKSSYNHDYQYRLRELHILSKTSEAKGHLTPTPYEYLNLSSWLKPCRLQFLCKMRLKTYALGFPGDASDKEPARQSKRHKRDGFDPWVGKISWRREWHPLQCSCLENRMARGAWQVTVHGVAKGQTWLKWLSMHTCLGGFFKN